MRPLLAAAALLLAAAPALAGVSISGLLEGNLVEIEEAAEEDRWSVRRSGMPTLELRPRARQARLVMGDSAMAITYEPLPFFPPEGAEAFPGPDDAARGCRTMIWSTGADAVAHCRAEDGRLLWAVVRGNDGGWRLVWVATP